MVGLSHQTAPVEVRERLAFTTPGALVRALDFFKSALGPGGECALVSTCNRTELYIVPTDDAGAGDLPVLLARARGGEGAEGDPEIWQKHLVTHRGHNAAEHLFRVASGLDSMILGEPDVVRQVKAAYAAASEAGTAGPTLNPLFHRALAVAKRVRTETGVGRGAFSVGHAAGELARNIFGDLKGRTVLLLGAGKMSETTARHLAASGANSVLVANRTFDRAARLAEALNGRAVHYDALPEHLAKADIVIASTAAPHAILGRALVESTLRARRHRPLFLIDIAVPRDIEPGVGDLPDVFLYNIDDLRAVVASEEAERRSEAVRAERLVREESVAFASGLREAHLSAPLVSGVRAKMDAICSAELARLRARLPHVSEADWRLIETTVAGIQNKTLHDPTIKIREYARDGSPHAEEKMNTVRELFNLNEADEAEKKEGVLP